MKGSFILYILTTLPFSLIGQTHGIVTVNGTSNISGTFNLKSDVNGTASFIAFGGVSGIGITNAEVYMTGGSGNFWHNYSSPVSGQKITSIIWKTDNNIPKKYVSPDTIYGSEFYDESNGNWEYFKTTTANISTLTADPGYGYLFRRTSDGILTSSGSLNGGPISTLVTRVRYGWNAVGNPYSSSIGLNSGSTITNFLSENATNLDSSFVYAYFWNGTNYVMLGNTSDATFIRPGQGFLIKAKVGGGSVNFTPDMQSHQINPYYYKKSLSANWQEIIIRVKASNETAYTRILFREDMSNGLDVSYDGGLFIGNEKLVLYTRLVEDNGVNFAIQCLPDAETEPLSVPIGLDCKDGGIVAFTAEINSLPAGYTAILEDISTGTFTDLSLPGAKYEVAVLAGTTGTGRFFLHITEGPNGLKPSESYISLYSIKKEIYIQGIVSNSATASVYDLSGRKMAGFSLSQGQLNILNANALREGIYIVKVFDEGVIETKRVFISE